ncbi:hypothetical protein N7462_010779 [Penicillium macrosclerotiorum]|uniref:uncharacterized protein n=1 Tax=Penicillium macrosclerotiorum TaxID=303699 RepID=UPI002547C29C|nr:uncharacterized protein N7462_010779 [Penicillium macrosclerotiorum]KAJ5669709.1 hypothetical protein N7462_010779 [Penicillium macrosclerotiorum]
MAFGFGSSIPAGGSASMELGPEVPEVFTDHIGFKGVHGDANVRLLSTPWPEDALPSPTTSLLAVAQSKGVLVGAGPDALVVASTEAVRKAIEAPTGEEKIKTKPFQPQATIPLPARPTHVAFTASEDALIVATENGSQLSIFETNSLSQSNAQPALSVSTNGVTIRSLAPNPDPTSTFVALVTINGELLIADLKSGNIVSNANGPFLRTGVSTVGWSNKGKQLVAGMADGTAEQMTPDGTKKDHIPRPSDLEGECHVSSIAWLENDIFCMVYTPNAPEDDYGIPASSYYIITRRKQAPFLIQKMSEICSPIGFNMKRSPAYQFIVRLRDYKPHMKDVLIVSSTCSSDIGLIARSEQPLASDETAMGLAGHFAPTGVDDDIKRASVPLKDDLGETSVIGMAPYFCSNGNVIAPIVGDDDIQESSTPLPGLLLLNNDGILSSWWFIYNDAIRQNVPYSGLVSGSQIAQQPAGPSPALAAAPAQQQATFGQSSFGSASPFGSSTFGKPSGGPSFGSPSPMGAAAFGKPSAPSFGSPSTLGGGAAPSFGKPSTPGPAFGAPSQPGSGFGAVGSTFGQPSTPGKSLLGPGTGTTGGGFSSFSRGGGFGGFAAAKPGESPFAKASGESAFTKASTSSPFGSKLDTETAFAPPKSNEIKNPFGSGASGFSLGSTFKADSTAAKDEPKSDKPSSGAFFGGSFDEMVTSKPETPGETMDDTEDKPAPEQPQKTQPTSIFGAPIKSTTQTSSLFGSKPIQPAQPQPFVETSKPSTFSIFGNSTTTSTAQSSFQTNTSQNQVTSPLSAPSDKTETPKREPSVSTPTLSSLEAPLPPDSMSRASYAPGDTSASSNVSKSSVDDAPLPPDFTTATKPTPKSDDVPPPSPFFIEKQSTPKLDGSPRTSDFISKPKKTDSQPPVIEDAPLPPDPSITKIKSEPEEETVSLPEISNAGSDADQDADESDFSDSGEEITRDETKIPSPKPSAESSFGGFSDKSSTGGIFSGVSKTAPKQTQGQPPRQLFGEIPKQPLLPPPGPAARNGREPYRSPSPTRVQSQKSTMLSRNINREPGSALASRKASLTQIAQRDGQLRKVSDSTSWQEQAHASVAAQRQEEEILSLSDDDEDERLRADLARPAEPAATLDPFLPHQNYTGETAKPGIPGMIERLYRDINSMVDTLGVNARSLESYLLYQQPPKKSDATQWVTILKGEQPDDVLDKEMFLQDIANLEDVVTALSLSLNEERLQSVEDKLDQCRELLTKEIVTLRGQCASIRKTLDAHTDTGAILSAPLSAEQATLQHDLRTAFTTIQAKMADLEQGVSMLRAKLADVPRPDGAASTSRKRPTVEAVTSTIATMMSMAESKSSDIDLLEAQMRKLGVDVSSTVPASRENSPFTTPRKNAGRFPTTPGSRGSIDNSAYHTPESASRGGNFRASITGSAKHSRLRSVDIAGPVVVREDTSQWKAKTERRKHLVGNLKSAFEKRKVKVRGMDDL